MQIHTSINIESFLNNVNIYILFEVRALILFISVYIYIKKRTDITEASSGCSSEWTRRSGV